MKSNWVTKKLGEVILENKKSKIKAKSALSGGNFKFFKSGEKTLYCNQSLCKGENIFLATGGKAVIHYFNGDASYSTDTYSISGNSLTATKFLHYFLLLNLDLIEKKMFLGASIRHLQKNDFKNIPILLPSLPEQRRIVKILDEVFEKIAKAKENAEKNLQNAKELFESYLQSVFTNPGKDWEEKRLEELGEITSSKRIYKKEYVKDGVPFYRIKEIKELARNKNITLELYISKKRYMEIKDIFGVPIIGDILITAVGTIGEIYVVKNDEEFYFKDGNILWFKNFNSIDPYFLKFVLMSFIEQINKLSKGSAYSALTIEKIEKHIIFFPKSLIEQKSIVKKLDALSAETKKLEAIYKQKLADLEELKKSVLKKAFAGEL